MRRGPRKTRRVVEPAARPVRLNAMGIAELTVGQAGALCGVYTQAELDDLGMDPKQLVEAIGSGGLVQLRRRWFATGGHDPEVAQAVKTGGVLSCVSALRRHGLWIPPGYPDTHVRFGRPAAAGLAPVGASQRRSCRGFSRMRAGVTAVDSVITALECAARCMRAEDWIAVCDSVQNTHGVSAEALRGEMGRLPTRVTDLFARTDGRSQSGTESVCRVRLRARGFDVEVQPSIAAVGHSDLRIGKLILECDGRQYHSSAEDYHRDRDRDRKALIGGYIVMRFTYDDIIYGWAESLADIRAITLARRHRLRPFRGAADDPN